MFLFRMQQQHGNDARGEFLFFMIAADRWPQHRNGIKHVSRVNICCFNGPHSTLSQAAENKHHFWGTTHTFCFFFMFAFHKTGIKFMKARTENAALMSSPNTPNMPLFCWNQASWWCAMSSCVNFDTEIWRGSVPTTTRATTQPHTLEYCECQIHKHGFVNILIWIKKNINKI